MKNKEELLLMWIIVGFAMLICTILFPPTLLIGLVIYASWKLYNHYTLGK